MAISIVSVQQLSHMTR